jgi:uroporphyrinogen-III decarboxylase
LSDNDDNDIDSITSEEVNQFLKNFNEKYVDIIQLDNLDEFASSEDLYNNFDCDINNGCYDFIPGSLGLVCIFTAKHILHENNEDRVTFSLCTFFLCCLPAVIRFLVCCC